MTRHATSPQQQPRQPRGPQRGERSKRGERGSMSLELVLLSPVLVAGILAIAAGARYADAHGETITASFAAARAASLTTSPDAAVAAGRQAAARAMADRGRSCAPLTVTISADGFQPGGDIRVTVTCRADLSDLTGFGLPGSKTFTETAVVPIEEHRVL